MLARSGVAGNQRWKRNQATMRHMYEVIVIGCGGIGSAAAYWLARRIGSHVLAIEQFALGHDRGSSQDHSRIIRRSYHDPSYTALAGPAYDLWSDIEAESGVQLVFKTGGLDLEQRGTTGPKDLSHCAETMTADGIAYDDLNAEEIMGRWPQFRLPDDARGLYQADSGLVDAGKANAVHRALARGHGADIRDRLPVRAIRSAEGAVEVVTDDGVFSAEHLVVAAGAWTNSVLGRLGITWPLTVTQEQVTYFATPNLREFMPDRFRSGSGGLLRSFMGFRSTARSRPRRGRMSAAKRSRPKPEPSSRIKAPKSGWSPSWRHTFPGFWVRSCTPRRASIRCRQIGTSLLTHFPVILGSLLPSTPVMRSSSRH